jgi:hypothetical protein
VIACANQVTPIFKDREQVKQLQYPSVSEALQKTLDDISTRDSDRKDEVVDLLGGEQPSKSRMVDMAYSQCVWWEGCYYCQDESMRWYQVKCFI